MNQSESESFSDPSLKNAVKRIHSSECAPAALTRSVQQTLAGEWSMADVSMSQSRSLGWWERWQSLVYSGLAACVVLAGIGVLVLGYMGHFDQRNSYSVAPTGSIVSTELANAMVAQHEQCRKGPEHPPVSRDDLQNLQQALQTQLGFPVVALVPNGGWTLRGAGPCALQETPAAHFLFQRGKQEVSVFALPAGVVRQVHGGKSVYQKECGGCPVAAAVHGPALYAAVGSSADGSLMLSEVAAIRDQFIARLPDEMGDSCPIETPLALIRLPFTH